MDGTALDRAVARVPDPEGQAHPGAAGRPRARRRPAAGRTGEPARHLAREGREGARGLARERNPAGLPAAGCRHQRQAHRDDRPADAPARAHHARSGDTPSSSTSRSRSSRCSRRRTTRVMERGGQPAVAEPMLLGITKASLSDRLAPSRRRRSRDPRAMLTESRDHGQEGRPAWLEGERDRRTVDPGGHRPCGYHTARKKAKCWRDAEAAAAAFMTGEEQAAAAAARISPDLPGAAAPRRRVRFPRYYLRALSGGAL